MRKTPPSRRSTAASLDDSPLSLVRRPHHRNLSRFHAHDAQHLNLLLAARVEDDAIVAGFDRRHITAPEATTTTSSTTAATTSPTTSATACCELTRLCRRAARRIRRSVRLRGTRIEPGRESGNVDGTLRPAATPECTAAGETTAAASTSPLHGRLLAGRDEIPGDV